LALGFPESDFSGFAKRPPCEMTTTDPRRRYAKSMHGFRRNHVGRWAPQVELATASENHSVANRRVSPRASALLRSVSGEAADRRLYSRGARRDDRTVDAQCRANHSWQAIEVERTPSLRPLSQTNLADRTPSIGYYLRRHGSRSGRKTRPVQSRFLLMKLVGSCEASETGLSQPRGRLLVVPAGSFCASAVERTLLMSRSMPPREQRTWISHDDLNFEEQ
jgi:hypothetical protein